MFRVNICIYRKKDGITKRTSEMSEIAVQPLPASESNGLLGIPRRWLIHSVMSIALGLIALEITIVNVALPAIQGDLNASSTGLQWIVEAYVLVFAGVLLVMGSLGDRYGRRLFLQLGTVVFAGASVLAMIADSATTLIIARAVMGVGGAMIMPGTLSIIVDVFPRKDRVKAIAMWNAVGGMAVPLGLLLGGWLVENFWWGSVFAINIPVAVAIIAGTIFLVPESRDPNAKRPDIAGAVLSTAALSALVFAIIEGPAKGWASPLVAGGFALSVLAAVGFVITELRSDHPMLDVRLFRNRLFAWGAATVAIGFMALLGAIFILTQYVQIILGFGPFDAGLRFLPLPIGFIASAVITPPLVSRFGTRTISVLGLSILAIAVLMLMGVSTSTEYLYLGTAFLLFGLGVAMAMAPATEAVMRSVPGANAGVGSAVNDTARQVGGALGVGIAGSVVNSIYRSDLAGFATELPAEVSAAVTGSLVGAAQAASAVDGELGGQIFTQASSAFMSGLEVSLAVIGGTVIAGIAAVWIGFPGRRREFEELSAVPVIAPEPLAAD